MNDGIGHWLEYFWWFWTIVAVIWIPAAFIVGFGGYVSRKIEERRRRHTL